MPVAADTEQTGTPPPSFRRPQPAFCQQNDAEIEEFIGANHAPFLLVEEETSNS
ncbi:unnamed protein product [Gulo gulo]|uniref:Uncharacterized protein n=1 Tax=Gulo gulo TaxID=48420 RepID=A0A9X9PVX9_GULGU|nr:unnamed protein product [Gulo gulo]